MKQTFFLHRESGSLFYECPTEDFAICDNAIQDACPMAPNNIEVIFVDKRPHVKGWVQVKLDDDGRFYVGKNPDGYSKLQCQVRRMPASNVVWMYINY